MDRQRAAPAAPRRLHHLSLRAWDIDHVLIGPGGVYAIETKWSAQPWTLQPPEDRLRRAAQQARGNARDLQLWTGLRRAGITQVTPIVLLWGAGTTPTPEPAQPLTVDGVQIVLGPSATSWRASLPTGQLDPAQIDTAWQALHHQARRRDPLEQPVPPSLARLAVSTVAGVTTGLLGFVAAGQLLTQTEDWLWLRAAGCLTLLLLAVPLRRRSLTRLPALGWQTGLIAGLLLVAGELALHALS